MNFSLGVDLKGAVEGALGGALGSSKGRSQFELRIGPFVGGQLSVVSFEGHEALNEPFVYDVVFATSVAEDALQAGVFGFPACLSIHAPAPHEPRVIQGLAVAFEAIGAADAELGTSTRRYMTRIVPRLGLLEQQTRRRVFQERSPVEIARAILDANDLTPTATDIQVPVGDYPPLPFEYQRNESDLAFLKRVLATAGIFFYFRHASGLLDELIPGGEEAAALAGGLAAGALGGAVTGAAGFVSDAAAAVGAGFTTKLVATDQASATDRLGDAGLDAAGMAAGALSAGLGAVTGRITGAATAAFGAVVGGAVGAIAGSVGLAAGGSDALVFDGNGQAGSTATERVFSFRLLKQVRPKRVDLRSWNLRDAEPFTAETRSTPVSAGVDLQLSASLGSNGASFGFGAATHFDTDALPIPARQVTAFEYQRDIALQNLKPRDGHRAAQRALLQQRSDGVTAQGETDCRRLAPGYRFTLVMHSLAPLNAEYLVTETRSQGFSPEYFPDRISNDYRCHFRCVPSTVDPKPKKPPEVTYPPEPAVVIGPTVGDPHCDSLGRILVRFRWAAGTPASADEAGTCWVHWLEPWGGDGYGMQAVPRVGSEVTVMFYEGGEPFAVGQNRSRANRPAYELPREATKVGLRTRTVPNGAESEISIDDNPFSEKIFVRAAGDMETEVTRDTKTELHGKYDLTVDGERRERTEQDTTFVFAKDVTTGAFGSLREEVGKDRVEIVLGSATENVVGDVSRTVDGRMDTVTSGVRHDEFGSDSIERHRGHRAVVVAGSGGSENVSTVLHVEGAARAYAKGEIEAVSGEGFTLTCGDSHIAIRKDSVTITSPTITLIGKTVQVTASDTAAIAGKTVTVAGSDSVTVSGANTATLAGQSATVVLDSNATVKGAAVKLGSGGGGPSSQSAANKKKPPTRLVLNDQNGKPLADTRVIVRIGGEGGAERMVVLDAEGAVEVEGDGPIDVLFPEQPDAR